MPRPKSIDASTVEGIIDQRNYRGRVQYQIASSDDIPQWMDSDKLLEYPSIASLIAAFHSKDQKASTTKSMRVARKSRASDPEEKIAEEAKEEKKSRSRSRARSSARVMEEKISTPRRSRSKKEERTVQSSGKRGRPKKETIEVSEEETNTSIDDRQLSIAEELKQPIDYFASHFKAGSAVDEKIFSETPSTKESTMAHSHPKKEVEEIHRHGRPINHSRGQAILLSFVLLFSFTYFSILDHSSAADRTSLAGILPSILPNSLWRFLNESLMESNISCTDILAVPLYILISQLLDGRRGIYEQRALHCAVLLFIVSFYRYLVEGSSLTINPLAPPVFHTLNTAIASFHLVFLIRNVTSNKLTVARFLYSALSATVSIIVLYHRYTKSASTALMHHHLFTLLAAAAFDAILSFRFIVIAYSRALAKSFEIASGLLMVIGSTLYGIILYHSEKSRLTFSESWCAATILCTLDFLWMLDAWMHQKKTHA